MTEIEAAIVLLKQNDFIVCVPSVPGAPIPEPERGQLWVAPSPRVTPRTIAPPQSLWVIDFFEPGVAKPRGVPRGSFLAWARRSGARPVAMADEVVSDVEAEPEEPLPFWKRIVARLRSA